MRTRQELKRLYHSSEFQKKYLYEGSDLGVYQVGHGLKAQPGVLEAYDMTTEAVVAKLMWILGQTRRREEVERLFYTPVARDILWPGL